MPEIALDLDLWPRQFAAFETEATELLFGGATEGGKSHFLRVALVGWCLEIKHLSCVLIRKRYQDIQSNHVEGRTGFRAILAPLLQVKLCEITQDEVRFANGSRIFFQHCQDERQFDSAQGIERHVLAIDEATQISERLIRFFRGWVRMPVEMKETLPAKYKDKFPRIIYTANPIGVSVGFFRREFVKARAHEAIEKIEGFKRQYMLSRYTDNPSVDAEAHKGRLSGIGDEQLAKALDVGDWNALVGEFFPEWDEGRHVVKDFHPPEHWYRYRSGDIGWSEPAAYYWIAVSDGEPFHDFEGNERWFPRGARIFYQEWYVADEQNPAKGLNLSNHEMAEGIFYRSEAHAKRVPTLTDSKPFQTTGGKTPAKEFEEKGIILTQVDTGPGSRVSGWAIMRSALIGERIDGFEMKIPMVYFCECCRYARDYIPALPRHPSEGKKEDAAEHGEATHACDAIRYGLIGHQVIKDNVREITPAMIEKEVKAQRPTMKRITGSQGNAYFY